MNTVYVLADRIGCTQVRNTYFGMSQDDISSALALVGCTNIQFVTKEAWDATAPAPSFPG